MAFMNPVILAVFQQRFYTELDSLAKRMHTTLTRYTMLATLFTGVDLSWRRASLRAFILCIVAVSFLIFIVVIKMFNDSSRLD
jgi:hypothetical protein